MNKTTGGSSFNIVGASGRDATDMPTVATNIFGPRQYSQFNNRKDSKMSNKQSSSDDNSMPTNTPTPMAGSLYLQPVSKFPGGRTPFNRTMNHFDVGSSAQLTQ